ncbi:hypothetical protein STEG23_030698 [Scotinomys teguina]
MADSGFDILESHKGILTSFNRFLDSVPTGNGHQKGKGCPGRYRSRPAAQAYTGSERLEHPVIHSDRRSSLVRAEEPVKRACYCIHRTQAGFPAPTQQRTAIPKSTSEEDKAFFRLLNHQVRMRQGGKLYTQTEYMNPAMYQTDILGHHLIPPYHNLLIPQCSRHIDEDTSHKY